MHIFLPVLTVWSKQTAYAAQLINHAGLCFVHPENIATPSAVRAASSHILLERWTEKGPVSRSGARGLRVGGRVSSTTIYATPARQARQAWQAYGVVTLRVRNVNLGTRPMSVLRRNDCRQSHKRRGLALRFFATAIRPLQSCRELRL